MAGASAGLADTCADGVAQGSARVRVRTLWRLLNSSRILSAAESVSSTGAGRESRDGAARARGCAAAAAAELIARAASSSSAGPLVEARQGSNPAAVRSAICRRRTLCAAGRLVCVRVVDDAGREAGEVQK